MTLIDLDFLPPVLTDLPPPVLKWGLVAASVLVIFLAASFIKRVIKIIGLIASSEEHPYEGSAWDIGSSIAYLLSLIVLSPVPLSLAGFDVAPLIANRGPGAIAAVVTLILAILFAGWLSRSIRGFGNKVHSQRGTDDTLFGFIASLVKYLVFAVAMVFALTQLGFPTASLAALVGAAGLAIGLALQDTLKAVAAGVMLAIFRPFRLGDWVTLDSIDGEVTDITPFQTVLKQVDNKVVSLTNDRVWGNPLVNHTREARRRYDLYFDISYDDDMRAALDVLETVTQENPRILDSYGIWTGVHSLGDFSIKLRLRAWVATADFVDVRAELIRDIKLAFDAAGITIPYPHQVEIQYAGKPNTASGSEAIKGPPSASE